MFLYWPHCVTIAIPFGFDRPRAILETYLHGSTLTTPLDVPFSDHFKRFQTLLKNFNVASVTPRIQPVYFPTWRVEAEALSKMVDCRNDEADVSLNSS